MPEVCPITSIGIYLLCFDVNIDALFPGSAQYDRFRKLLVNILTKNCAEELLSRGMVPTDIGTHSVRKGATSFCSGGSTVGPSETAVYLRGGWTMGGIQNTYMRYERASDQYLGRTLSGLPINHEEFALLPSFFLN